MYAAFAIVAYILLVHALLGLALTQSDLIARLRGVLNISPVRPEQTAVYRKILSFHRRADQNSPENQIAFFGDSHIQGLAVAAIAPKSVNWGISGDTTRGLIKRLPLYSSLSRTGLIVIEIGINDFPISSDGEILENYNEIAGSLPRNIPVLFSAILPVDDSITGKHQTNQRITKINSGLRKICGNYPNVHFLDISADLTDSTGGLSSTNHIGDGMHLSALGYSIWITKLREKITELQKHEKHITKIGNG